MMTYLWSAANQCGKSYNFIQNKRTSGRAPLEVTFNVAVKSFRANIENIVNFVLVARNSKDKAYVAYFTGETDI